MNNNPLRLSLIALSCAVISLTLTGCAAASGSSVSSLLSQAKSASSSLTQAEISSGLKEALNIGVVIVKVLSANNGYYNDLATRIGLPSEAVIITKNVAKLLAVRLS